MNRNSGSHSWDLDQRGTISKNQIQFEMTANGTCFENNCLISHIYDLLSHKALPLLLYETEAEQFGNQRMSLIQELHTKHSNCAK